jgi:hypothetical protein
MPDMHVRAGGAWKKVNKVHVRVGGAWKEVQNGYVRVSGAWKKFFQSVVVSLANRTISGTGTDPGTAEALYRLGADGKIYERASPAAGFTEIGSWIDPESAASGDYVAIMTKQSGSKSLSTGSEATEQALSADRTYGISQTGVGSGDYVGLIEAKRGGTTLDSATITLNVNVDLGI